MAWATRGKNFTVRLISWLSVSTWFLAMAPSCFSFRLNSRELYLDSPADCSNDRYNEVARTSVYNVKDQLRPFGTPSFRSCEMVFRSTRRDGRLCMMQKQLKFDSFDVKLEIFDGWKGVNGLSKPHKTLDKAQGLMSVEWCTSRRYLTIRVSEKGSNPSMEDVEIDLMVYDMQSYHRKASMDSLPFCGSKFLMDGSLVNVANLDPQGKVKEIFQECKLTFEYVGHEANRSLCLVFESILAANPGCNKLNYTLNIFSHYQHPGKKEVLSGERTCEQPTPRQWCSNTTKISLELHRETKSGSTKTAEDAVMFYALVVDHEGGPETLPLLAGTPSESSSAHAGLTAGVVVASVVFIIIIAVIAVFLFRRRRNHNEKEEETEEKEEKEEKQTEKKNASYTMLIRNSFWGR